MTASVYLSAQNPRWIPRSEHDLVSAAANGLLEETHYLDLKREIKPGGGSNKELARDIAQFAVDGGTLLIGIAEVPGGHPELAPVALAGLAERIEQVARSIPDPPLPVECSVIRSADNADQGFVLVHVPTSGLAPHMVDGVYYGRGDKTRVRLSDAEVMRLHRGRVDADAAVDELVSAYVARDPVPADLRRQAHLFIVASPVAPRREMALHLTSGGSWQTDLLNLVARGGRIDATDQDRFAPDLFYAKDIARRHDGAALTYGLTRQRELASLQSERFDGDLLELEVSDQGTLRLMTTRLSDSVGSGDSEVLFETMMPILTRRVVGLACAMADNVGYAGPWMLGVAATKIAGLQAFMEGGRWDFDARALPKDQDEYRRHTTATNAELLQTPGAVTERLVGRFLRSLGLDAYPRVTAFITDSDPVAADDSGDS